MITKPTVLVLGAGASKPYGFPTGAELAASVHRKLTEAGAFVEGLKYVHSIGHDEISSFIDRFPQSGCETLDEFMETEGNKPYLPLVKTAIVAELVACERDDKLVPQVASTSVEEENRRREDWHVELFREMKDGVTAATFGKNKLRIITFNFDRSFERRLFLMLRSAYALSGCRRRALARNDPRPPLTRAARR